MHAVEDKPGFFAERLRDAIACIGTKDRQLIRIVVSRCEIDMQEIKRAYQLRYQKSLEQAISVWCSLINLYLIFSSINMRVLHLIKFVIFHCDIIPLNSQNGRGYLKTNDCGISVIFQ